MVKSSQELKPVIKRKPLPPKVVANLRGKIRANGAMKTAYVTLHQDFLLNMFNPNSEEMDRFERTYYDEDGSISKQTIVVKDYNNKLPEHQRGKLPNIAQFKMFLWMLKQAQANNTNTLDFDSRTQCLESLGYSICNDNFDLLLKTINTFFHMNLVFTNEFNKIVRTKGRRAGKKVVTNANFTVLRGSYQEIDKVTKKVTSVHIWFDRDFLDVCKGICGYMKYIDINKIHQIDSPLTLKIYLFLAKWSNTNDEFQKSYAVGLKSFLETLGFIYDELTSDQIRKIKFKIKQSLVQIAEIDPKVAFELNDDLFSNKNNRQIKFEQIL